MSSHFFKSVKVENFRGIKSLQVEDLAKVNVFFGKNSCGKTSLLESLFLLGGISNPGRIIAIENLRGIILNQSSDIRDFFYKQDHDRGFTMSCIQETRGRKLEVYPVHGNTSGQISPEYKDGSGVGVKKGITQTGVLSSETRQLIGLKSKFYPNWGVEAEGSCYEAKVILKSMPDTNLSYELDKKYKETLNCRFLNNSVASYDSVLVDNMLKEKHKDVILKWLKSVESKIQDVIISLNGAVMVDIGLDNFIPLNLLGDGLLRILNILSGIYATKNGVLMIDEIENGLHVSSIQNMLKMVFEHSNQTKTQIFMTTHSKDVIEGLKVFCQGNLLQETSDEFACFWLNELEKTDQIKAYRYSPKELEQALNSDIDVRH